MEAGSSGRQVARRTGDRIEVRAEPVRCRMRLNGLTTSDEHSIDLTFSCTVSTLDQPAERQMLAETFLTDRDIVTAEHVAAHFTPPLREAAARMIESHPAEHWLDESTRPAVIEAIRKAANPIAFASGVELFPPLD